MFWIDFLASRLGGGIRIFDVERVGGQECPPYTSMDEVICWK
jgi:hypothetical protein